MLLAIDVGNTHTVYGLWDGSRWAAVWRRRTDIADTEDELAAWLRSLFDIAGIEWRIDDVVCASVVPDANEALARLSDRWLCQPIRFLRNGEQVGIAVRYQPANAVGADRIANALGALEKYRPPIVVVDFGTATTFDAIDRDGAYAGGAILPGVIVSSEALFARAARLPHVEQVSFQAPSKAIGTNTVEALQSGIMLGYAGSVEALVGHIARELGGSPSVIATGGLGGMFMGLCPSIQAYEPELTLDGLRIASSTLGLGRG